MPERTAFFGGTFDPPHLGHLIVAQDALEGLGLDRVVFIPAGQNPLKERPPVASAVQRLEMLKLAVEGYPRFAVWDGELERGGPSYTIDTLEAVRRDYPGEAYWIIGEDQIPTLDRWHRAAELAQLVRFVCLARPGVPKVTPPAGFAVEYVMGHPVGISSTELRERMARGLGIAFFVPQQVQRYVEAENVYGEG